MKDLSLNFKLTQRTNEETIARKTKEVDTILKEKKCKNCILCLEDLKDKPSDIMIKDLNERLVTKTNKIAQLEDQVRKSTSLVSQVCNHTFTLLRTKANDFVKSTDQIKQKYEIRLMEVEEKLGLEQKQCQTVIQTRVAALEERYAKLKHQFNEQSDKLK